MCHPCGLAWRRPRVAGAVAQPGRGAESPLTAQDAWCLEEPVTLRQALTAFGALGRPPAVGAGRARRGTGDSADLCGNALPVLSAAFGRGAAPSRGTFVVLGVRQRLVAMVAPVGLDQGSGDPLRGRVVRR